MVADEYPVDKADMQRETMELVLGEEPPLSASRATYICNTHPGIASQNISTSFVATACEKGKRDCGPPAAPLHSRLPSSISGVSAAPASCSSPLATL